MARIVLAPDKFKGSITARDVAAQVGAGITAVLPDAELVVVPVSDGGDGLLDVALSVGFERVDVEASGPLEEPVSSWYAVRGDEVVIEMAEICGLARASDLDAMGATSRGLGEAIATALDRGANSVLLGIGGSASTDGGAGVLEALGARLLDGSGSPCPPGGGGLLALASIDLSALHPRLTEVTITVACDVDNPLTGPRGAAAVYGPQKGAKPDQVAALDQALTRLADIVSDATGSNVRDAAGAGAAGGVGYAALAVLGATLRSGVDVVLDLVDFADALEGADLVVTGEGMLDEQTLNGKAPAGVAAAARARGIPVVAVCGARSLSDELLRKAGIGAVHVISDLATEPRESFERPGPLLQHAGRAIARELKDSRT